MAKKTPNTQSPSPPASGSEDVAAAACVRQHLRLGWLMLLFFLTLGAILESMHGFKVAFYTDVANDTRRLMWTLAHAHGTLIAMIQIGFALTVRALPGWSDRPRTIASRCLLGAAILLPLGFLLGGVKIYAGDPGPLIALVPVGAVLLFVSVFMTARAAGRSL